MITENPFETPVAFLIFNRPENTRQVFRAIRNRRPKTLLVVADGPRPGKPGERDRCLEARAVVDQGIDWECTVLRDYSDINLGCRNRISSGLTWVFQQVEEAVILEDDCVPHPTFFDFCRDMLERYRHDGRIFSVGGSNIQPASRRFPYSYYCTRYPQIWGWATWRRAWKHYDVTMRLWPEARKQGLLRSAFGNLRTRLFWESTFDRCHRGGIDTWDYQFSFTCLLQHGVNLVARENLISNIGFGSDATHTTEDSPLASLAHGMLEFPLRHPPHLFPDPEADSHFDRHLFRLGLRGFAHYAVDKLVSRSNSALP